MAGKLGKQRLLAAGMPPARRSAWRRACVSSRCFRLRMAVGMVRRWMDVSSCTCQGGVAGGRKGGG